MIGGSESGAQNGIGELIIFINAKNNILAMWSTQLMRLIQDVGSFTVVNDLYGCVISFVQTKFSGFLSFGI